MGKTRPEKLDVDAAIKKEKKHIDAKVTKHDRKDKKSKKAEKPSHQTESGPSDDEKCSKGSGDEGGALLENAAHGREMVEGSGGEAAARKKQKKAERKKEKQAELRANELQMAESMATVIGPTTEANDIFVVDVNPTPVDPEKLKAPSDDEDVDMEDGGARLQQRNPGYTAPPSGLNRAVRRRIKLIEKAKANIQKTLGVPVGSDDKADEVQVLLDKWVQAFDEKAERRQAKKKDSKNKGAARLRNKSRQPEKDFARKNKSSRSS